MLALLADHHVAKAYICSFCIYCTSASEWYLFHAAQGRGGGEGKQKCATKNCTPVAQGMIEPSVNNGFPT